MIVLGIAAFYHDSSVALIKDGKVLFAAEEERFSRKKHDDGFPYLALEACWKTTGIVPDQVDVIAYYEKPLLKFERILETFVKTFPFSLQPFIKAIPDWLQTKIKVEYTIRKALGYKKKIYFIPHHLSHAAAAFLPSPFSHSAIATIDGIGEYQTTALWYGEGTTIRHLASLNFPHSLGLLYSTFTAFLGFHVNEDEYKMMGLSAYGKPVYVHAIRKILDIKKDGSFSLDMKYFRFRESFQMWSNHFENLFGSPRMPVDAIEQRHKDIAASIQAVTEDILYVLLTNLYSRTKTDTLCLSGGVALNALANGKIVQKTPFKKLYILGPSGDSGSAIGCALYTYFMLHPHKRKSIFFDSLNLGTAYSDKEILLMLQEDDMQYKKYTTTELQKKVALVLTDNKIVGVFHGRMEFGPRALGYRSILANPKNKSMKDKVNNIKGREAFRPFGGVFLQKYIQEYVEVPFDSRSFPFMNMCFQVKKNKKKLIPAITHVDGSCRIQTIDKNQPFLYGILENFYKKTGISVLLNTSFNLKGEPIIETPQQAIDTFLETPMDYLVIGNYFVEKL